MKKFILLFVLLIGFSLLTLAQVSINETGNDPDASAMLDVSSNNKGVLIPRMTSTEREAIVAPANGLMVFDLTTSTFWFYNLPATAWVEIKEASVNAINDLLDAKNDNSSVFIGHNGQNDDGSNRNTAVGNEALIGNVSGMYNIALGHSSLKQNTGGTDNVAVGTNTLENNTSGGENVAVGSLSLYNNGAGSQNTALGVMSGYGSNASTGIGNVFLGYRAGYFEEGSNKLYIENSDSNTPLIGGDFENDIVNINGKLTVSDTATIQSLKVEGGVPAEGKVLTSDAQGNATWQIMSPGVESLDGLADVAFDNSSLYIGHNGGADDGNNKNTATGKLALSDNTSGQYNVAYGHSSLNYNTSGIDNAAFGSNSLEFNSTGNQNTAIGSQALYHNVGGSQNTAIGYMSGYGSVGETATGNVFIGYQAGFYEAGSNKLYIANSDTYDPLIYGDFALAKLKFNGEIAITGGNPGNGKALISDEIGNASWSFVNPNDLENVIADETSIFFGANTGIVDDGSNYNTGFGHGSMEFTTQGNKNTTLGFNALRKNTLGNQNTAIGFQTLYNNTTGSGNIAIGNLAGYNATSSNSIFIGTSAGFNATADNQLYIDNTSTETPLIHGDFENDELQINGSVVLGEGDSISYSTPLVRNMRIHSSAFVPATRTTTTAEISYFETHMEITGDDVVVQAYAPINIQSNWVVKGLVYYVDVPQESTVNVSICYVDPFEGTIQTEIIHSAQFTNGEVRMFTDFSEAGLPFNPRSQFYIMIDLLPNANLDPLKFYGAEIVYEITNVE